MFGCSSRFFQTANTNRVFSTFSFQTIPAMKFATTTLLFAPLLVAAHSAHEDLRLARHAKIARQAPTPASAPPPSPPATTPPPVVAPPPPAVSLLSTNPTAVPLTQIVSGQPPPATVPLATTYTAGTVPSGLPEAPGIPSRK